MGYKQSPFPMQQGTSSHASALKQKKASPAKQPIKGETLRRLYKENPELDQRSVAGPREATTKEKAKLQKKRDKQLKKNEKDKRKSELSEARTKGKSSRKKERKEERYQAKLDRASETLEERKARRKANRESWMEDLEPVFQAMAEPISPEAKYHFQKGKKSKKSKKAKENKRKRKQRISDQDAEIRRLEKENLAYRHARSDNPTGKDSE